MKLETNPSRGIAGVLAGCAKAEAGGVVTWLGFCRRVCFLFKGGLQQTQSRNKLNEYNSKDL